MTVKVSKRSPISGKLNVMELPTTFEKICQWRTWNRSPEAPLIQDYFQELSNPEREFVLTGIHPAEWDDMMQETEEENPGDS